VLAALQQYDLAPANVRERRHIERRLSCHRAGDHGRSFRSSAPPRPRHRPFVLKLRQNLEWWNAGNDPARARKRPRRQEGRGGIDGISQRALSL